MARLGRRIQRLLLVAVVTAGIAVGVTPVAASAAPGHAPTAVAPAVPLPGQHHHPAHQVVRQALPAPTTAHAATPPAATVATVAAGIVLLYLLRVRLGRRQRVTVRTRAPPAHARPRR